MLLERTPDQCQDSRITHHLPQKIQDSLVQTSPRLRKLHVHHGWLLYLRRLGFFFSFFICFFWQSLWSQGLFQASGKMRWMITRDSSHFSLWAPWDQPNPFHSLWVYLNVWVVIFCKCAAVSYIMCPPPDERASLQFKYDLQWHCSGFWCFSLTVCLRCNVRESRHY